MGASVSRTGSVVEDDMVSLSSVDFEVESKVDQKQRKNIVAPEDLSPMHKYASGNTELTGTELYHTSDPNEFMTAKNRNDPGVSDTMKVPLVRSVTDDEPFEPRISLWFIGPEGSGKSTLFKEFQMLYTESILLARKAQEESQKQKLKAKQASNESLAAEQKLRRRESSKQSTLRQSIEKLNMFLANATLTRKNTKQEPKNERKQSVFHRDELNFDASERKHFISVIHTGILQNSKHLLTLFNDFCVSKKKRNKFSELEFDDSPLTFGEHVSEELMLKLKSFFFSQDTQTFISSVLTNNLTSKDSLFVSISDINCFFSYFFLDKNFDRITSKTYIPNHKDILHTNVRTSGIITKHVILFPNLTNNFTNLNNFKDSEETSSSNKKKNYYRNFSKMHVSISDTGGAKSERRKWMSTQTLTHYRTSSDLLSLVFINSIIISDNTFKKYQKSSNSQKTKIQENDQNGQDNNDKVEESEEDELFLWKEVLNNNYFKDLPICLVLTKTDICLEDESYMKKVEKLFSSFVSEERKNKKLFIIVKVNCLDINSTKKGMKTALRFFSQIVDNNFSQGKLSV